MAIDTGTRTEGPGDCGTARGREDIESESVLVLAESASLSKNNLSVWPVLAVVTLQQVLRLVLRPKEPGILDQSRRNRPADAKLRQTTA